MSKCKGGGGGGCEVGGFEGSERERGEPDALRNKFDCFSILALDYSNHDQIQRGCVFVNE